MTYTIKLFEFMFREMPMVMPNFGDWVPFNKKNSCGINVDVANPKDVGAAIDYLFNNPDKAKRMGENGRKAVLSKYTWEREFSKLINIYEGIINRKGSKYV